MDVVYVCRQGENEELRYSLRSLKHLPHGKVFIFGAWPEWVTGCECVPISQNNAVVHDNAESSVRAACLHPDVSDPFLLMNDDFYIMQPLEEVPVLNFGTISDVVTGAYARYKAGQYVQQMLYVQGLLMDLGFEDPLSFELHVPMVFDKAALLKVLDDHCKGSGVSRVHYRTLYGNLNGLRGQTIEDVKVYEATGRIPQGPWLSSNDATFKAIEPVLRYVFPDVSPYERPWQTVFPDGCPVYSPNRAYNGVTAGIQFVDGRGIIPAGDQWLVSWFTEHGYTLGAYADETEGKVSHA